VVIGDWHGPTTMRCAHLLIVSDETVVVDLNTKSRLYGAAGYPFTGSSPARLSLSTPDPTPTATARSSAIGPGDRIPVPCADTSVAVPDLVGLG